MDEDLLPSSAGLRDGITLSRCFRELSQAISARAPTFEEHAFVRHTLRLSREAAEDAWQKGEGGLLVAEGLICDAVTSGTLRLWVMRGTQPEWLNPDCISPLWRETLVSGLYKSNEDPRQWCDWHPLYVLKTEWIAFAGAEISAGQLQGGEGNDDQHKDEVSDGRGRLPAFAKPNDYRHAEFAHLAADWLRKNPGQKKAPALEHALKGEPKHKLPAMLAATRKAFDLMYDAQGGPRQN